LSSIIFGGRLKGVGRCPVKELWEFVIGSPAALAVVVVGLVVLGLYGNWWRRKERREDIRRALKP
jgi:hypothetical protein